MMSERKAKRRKAVQAAAGVGAGIFAAVFVLLLVMFLKAPETGVAATTDAAHGEAAPSNGEHIHPPAP